MKENKKILLNDFVKKYTELNGATAKVGHVRSIIRRVYCPILEKKLILEMMVEKSKGAGNLAYLDMTLSKLNFTMAIIAIYTNLEIEKDEEGVPKTAEAYDMLVQSDLLSAICDEIGEHEMNELLSINAAVIDSWHEKNTSTAAYVSNLVEKIGLIFSTALGKELSSLTDMLSAASEDEKIELLNVLKESFKLK